MSQRTVVLNLIDVSVFADLFYSSLPMPIVTISQAAKLVRRGRASIYRDIDKGIVSKTVSASGETGIDTSELARAYGRLYPNETPDLSNETLSLNEIEAFAEKVDGWNKGQNASKHNNGTSGDNVRTAVLEEKLKAYQHRIELLERIVTLEATVRRDTVASLRSELASKDSVIKVLEHQVLMLEYKPSPAEILTTLDPAPIPGISTPIPKTVKRGLWARIFRR